MSGGYVVFFRHAERDAAAMSTGELAIADNAGVCAPGSELTAQGVADALAIGGSFKRHEMKVDRVYSSPTCRADAMATLAFGEHDSRRALTWPGMWTAEEQTSLTPQLLELLGTAPAAGANVVLVSHSNVLSPERIGVTVELNQADAAIFRPLGNRAFDFVGIVTKDEWIR
jgi:broad specificity phosphatase PhoE